MFRNLKYYFLLVTLSSICTFVFGIGNINSSKSPAAKNPQVIDYFSIKADSSITAFSRAQNVISLNDSNKKAQNHYINGVDGQLHKQAGKKKKLRVIKNPKRYHRITMQWMWTFFALIVVFPIIVYITNIVLGYRKYLLAKDAKTILIGVAVSIFLHVFLIFFCIGNGVMILVSLGMWLKRLRNLKRFKESQMESNKPQ